MSLNLSKIVEKTCKNSKFGKNVHNHLNNQNMSRILRYFEIYKFFMGVKGP